MAKPLALLLALLASVSVSARQAAAPSVAATELLDRAISIVRTNALRSNRVPWDVVEPQVRALAAGAQEPSDVYPAIRFLLASLGDHHSFLMSPAQTASFQNGGSQNPPPEIRGLQGGFGYLNMPSYSGAEAAAMRAYTVHVHEAIAALSPSTECGWVVDLRSNGGGNMWPMLAGLKPFLGNAALGTFESATVSEGPWVAGHNVDVEPPAALAALESAPVAVLTGPRTASSGENVVISFRGRPHTRSVGQPTAGLSTANRAYSLPDGSMIQLTTAVDADRTGRQYGDRIDPDELTEATPVAADTDATLRAATDWLRQSSGCGRSQ